MITHHSVYIHLKRAASGHLGSSGFNQFFSLDYFVFFTCLLTFFYPLIYILYLAPLMEEFAGLYLNSASFRDVS